jgi:type IV secretory pathway VirB10-like protein
MLVSMATRGLDGEIDRLYQLPLEEFTPARNALAKGAGAEAARIRALPKPPIAAWAVNQLYWRNPDVWNALLAAADNAHRVHRAVLAGKSGDVRAANKVHDEAVDKALKATLALLAEAGHPATDTTKHAIGTTLRALPGDEPPGRLTELLQPAGFGTLAGLSVAAGAFKPSKPASAPAAAKAAPASRAARPKVDAKALTRARQAAAAADRALREAENTARRDEFEKVRTEREEQRADEAVEKARAAAERAAADLKEAEAAAGRATRLRETAAQRARDAERALNAARKKAEAAAADLSAIEPE